MLFSSPYPTVSVATNAPATTSQHLLLGLCPSFWWNIPEDAAHCLPGNCLWDWAPAAPRGIQQPSYLGSASFFSCLTSPSPSHCILGTPSKQQFAFNGLPCSLLLKEHNLRHSHIKHLLEEEGKRKDNITGKSQYKTKHTACWVFRYNLGITESWIRKYKPVAGSYTAREP